MVWYGLAIGAVVGGDKADSEGFGGAKNSNNDSDSGGGQGLFSVFGHQVWLYIGGIIGFGKNVGAYFTTGPMIGADPDWAVGGGIHIRKAFGLGIVIPIRQALAAGAAHSDKLSYIIDGCQDYLAQANAAMLDMSMTGIDQAVSDPLYASMIGAVVATKISDTGNIIDAVREKYRDAKEFLLEKIL